MWTRSATCLRKRPPHSGRWLRESSAPSSVSADSHRVHLYRWGDGSAHFHVWFVPRPLGMLEASGMMLPLWEDVLPNVTDEELADAARRIAEAL